MKKTKLILSSATLFIAVTLFFGFNVYGFTDDEKKIKEFIELNGYISAEEATNLFEEKHQLEVKLPEKLPFESTHQLGKIENDGTLTLHYTNVENKPHQDFIIHIMYPESEVDKIIKTNDKVYSLTDGNKVYYRVQEGLHLLSFKKDSLGYSLGGVNKRNQKFNSEVLIEIAESIH